MARLLFFIGLLASTLSFAQVATVSQELKNLGLSERYKFMKSNSQTFQDYKVIKEVALDGFWKIVMDSVSGQKLLIATTKENNARVEANLTIAELTLKKEREAASQILFDSTHISFVGVDFSKKIFLTITAVVVAVFGLLISFIVGNMKLMRSNMKEKIVIADLISHEYEEFKRKTLEKQTKLSRELQNERNKLEELKTR